MEGFLRSRVRVIHRLGLGYPWSRVKVFYGLGLGLSMD